MGLDTTHDCYSGGYGGFSMWRAAVAAAAGYEIVDNDRIPIAKIDWTLYENENFAGIWKETPDDILLVLIVHSDCDGIIAAEHCAPLADRLEGLLPEIKDAPAPVLRDYYAMTRRFISGLREAAADGEYVDFF